ncbi:MAG: hypothetical protein ACE5OY_05975 [Candidatus Bathyarchaeia archaeon]
MRRTVKAVLFASGYILAFVVLPPLALRFVPEGLIVRMTTFMGLEVQAILTTLALIGLAMAATSFVEKMTDDWSPLHLLSSISKEGVSFYLTLYFIGLADPWSFGLVNRLIHVEQPMAPRLALTLLLDFRNIVILFAFIMGLSILKEALGFYYSRREKETTSPSI